ncbi:MAG: FAD-dependent oxidoreductase [Alphaproteobacteria bacterium]
MQQGEGVEFDVVVVGGGGAGLAAAIEAARAGASVVLLEKNPELGGTTLRSVGSLTSTGTRFQARAGIEDSPEAHGEDLVLFNRAKLGDADARDNPELRRLLTESMPGTMKFLIEMGMVFFGPMPEPPHRLPRMHNILPHSRGFIFHMRRHALKAGIDIRTSMRADELLQANGRVTGVRASGGHSALEFTAKRGVVLATGDYSASEDFKARFIAPELAGIEGINPTSTGDGHALGLAAGGGIVNGDVMSGPEIRFVAPSRKSLIDRLPPWKLVGLAVRASMKILPAFMLRPFLMKFITTNLAPSYRLFDEGAVLVNREGKRFTDERDAPEFDIPRQSQRESWIVFDDRIAQKFSEWPYFISTAPGLAYAYHPDYRRNRRDISHSAATPEALAQMIGLPPRALAETIALSVGPSLDTAPYHALGPAKSWIAYTDGGLRVSAGMEVLGGNDIPIPGLFAAGSTGQGGVLLEGHGHHLGWAFTSGRIAGKSAAGK